MAQKDLLKGALLITEACAVAGTLAAVNTAKQNTDRGTFALAVKKNPDGTSTGQGGIDLDVALGAALVLVAAIAPPTIAPHLAAMGAGGLATYASRAGAAYGVKKATSNTGTGAQLVTPMPQTANGIPYGSLSGYSPRWGQPIGQVAPFVAGFDNAQPVYAGYHR